MAIVAMPARPSDEATIQGAPFFESVNPCPKIATGQPPAGLRPPGTKSVNCTSFVVCGTGVPVAVPYGGITFAAVSYSGDAYEPNATDATEPGKRNSAAVGNVVGEKVDVPIWRFHVIGVAAGKTVRAPPGPSAKVAGAGVDAWICARILREIAVMRCVVNKLAVAIASGSAPPAIAIGRASSNAFRYAFVAGSF